MLLTQVDLLDELLQRHAPKLGGDFVAYRNHCYRVVNFCAAFGPADPDTLHAMAIAAAFHDIGIWTHGSFDYLDPSEALALAYLDDTPTSGAAREIGAMIQQHHKITRCKPDAGPLTEAFRKADWIDVSLGLLRFGLPREFVREVRAAFPNAGFHQRLVQLSLRRLWTHPFSPMPMMRL